MVRTRVGEVKRRLESRTISEGRERTRLGGEGKERTRLWRRREEKA